MCCASVPPVRLSGLSGLSGLSDLSGLFGLSVCLLVHCVSEAFTTHDDTFRYELLTSRRLESCSMCFEDDCWEIQRDRCQYYAEVNEALSRTETGGEASEVDILVHDMVGLAAVSWIPPFCIPLVSQLTDCNKENICTGCKSCSCDALGRWRCKQVQRCRAEPELNVDHKVLVSVVESLKNDKIARMKRSNDEIIENPPTTTSLKAYAETAEWSHEVKPDMDEESEMYENKNNETHTRTRTESSKAYNIEADKTDNIEFGEVLRNVAFDNQKYNSRKPQLNKTNVYLGLGEIRVVTNNDTEQFINMLNLGRTENTTAEPIVETSSKVIIDLLASLKRDDYNKLNASDLMDLHSSGEYYTYDAKLNDATRFDAINIVKRDVSTIVKLNSTTKTTTEVNSNIKRPITGLENSVLIPLNKILNDTKQELKYLRKIKENLVRFITYHNDTDLDLKVNSQEVLNGTNTVLSIYNREIFPEIQFNRRKNNPDILDKLIYKTKRDIYEVIRDVVGIKKLSKTYNLSEDLQTLIQAMSFFVRKQGNITNIHNDLKLTQGVSLRRQLLDTEGNGNLNSTKGYLIKIIEVIDKDMPQLEALSPLSQTTRKIVKRVIKNHYVDDFSLIGLKVYGPDYNLTNDLRNVGIKWQRMTANVATTAPADKIYAMKLLHFTLSADINKLNDALALIDFAHSRRMIPIEGRLGEELLGKINNGMKVIAKKLQIVRRYHTGLENRAMVNKAMTPTKKKSFMNKLKNLLKGSKKDIAELVHEKMPPSKIVKTIAKKRLDELAQKKISEYEEIMKNWQNTLNVIPRDKRSLELSRINNRLKNIIPKYLRGKLNPPITAKKLKKNLRNTQNQAAPKKTTNTQRRKVVSTTMKTKTIAAKSKRVASRKNTNKKRTKVVAITTRKKEFKKNTKKNAVSG